MNGQICLLMAVTYFTLANSYFYIAGVAEFMGFPGTQTLICPQDPSEPAKLGYHANKYISIWDNGNRVSVTVDSYMAGVEAFKPNAFVALCDGETPKNSPSKRIQKSVVKTVDCLNDTCVILVTTL